MRFGCRQQTHAIVPAGLPECPKVLLKARPRQLWNRPRPWQEIWSIPVHKPAQLGYQSTLDWKLRFYRLIQSRENDCASKSLKVAQPRPAAQPARPLNRETVRKWCCFAQICRLRCWYENEAEIVAFAASKYKLNSQEYESVAIRHWEQKEPFPGKDRTCHCLLACWTFVRPSV